MPHLRAVSVFGLLALLLLLQACASASKRPAGEPGVDFPIIDVHTHTRFSGTPEKTSGIPDTREQFVKEMRENGVRGAVSHTSTSGKGYANLAEEGVIHCYGVGEKVSLSEIETGLKSRRYRCIKIYLGYIHRYAYDAVYQPVYELARRHKVPVVFHTGDTYSTTGKLKYAHPLTIDEVAVDWPDVTFVIAHAGNPWIQSAAEVAYKNPNVYLDGSAFLIGQLEQTPREQLEEYAIRPLRWVFGYVEDPGKLMFGTDWPLTDMRSYIRLFKEAIPPEHWRAVFHDNAVKVFGFAQP